MIARAGNVVPSLRGLGAAILVPFAFIAVGQLMLNFEPSRGLVENVSSTLVMLWPVLGFFLCPWVAGVAERRSGGDRRSVNMARVFGFGAYLLFGLIWVFGVPFDGEFYLGGFETGAGGLD